ncbi:MAG: 16S rRNA (guanine(966)-N(2))-methyltransferase RsmD [Pseudomonadales bacterium]
MLAGSFRRREAVSSNEVRIIGGMWRGRKLSFTGPADLRPTLGRVRETLFNWLAADIGGARCLDLYAGSGALGFEALSRGAASATLVEQDRRAAAALRSNAQRLQAEGCRVLCMSAERFIRSSDETWDIVFLDPPFDSDRLGPMLGALHARACLAAGGLVYFEASRRSVLTFPEWRIVRQGHAGETQFGLLASP